MESAYLKRVIKQIERTFLFWSPSPFSLQNGEANKNFMDHKSQRTLEPIKTSTGPARSSQKESKRNANNSPWWSHPSRAFPVAPYTLDIKTLDTLGDRSDSEIPSDPSEMFLPQKASLADRKNGAPPHYHHGEVRFDPPESKLSLPITAIASPFINHQSTFTNKDFPITS